jgi:hypothetical protein
MDRWFAWRARRDLVTGFYVGAFSVSLAVVSALWLVSALIVGTVVIADWIAGVFR